MKLVNSSNSNSIGINITDWRLLIAPYNKNSTDNQTDSPRGIDSDFNYINVYCAILGLIILYLVGFVIYKLWEQKSDSLLCTAIASKSSNGNNLRIQKCSPSAKSDTKEMAALVTSTEEMKLPSYEQFIMSQPLYRLSEDQIEAIVFSLSDESSGVGWLQLALYYNFKQDEIEFISQNNTKIEAVRTFLRKWSDNPNHTLKKLIKSLHEISRPDTAFLIKSAIRKLSHLERNEILNKEANNNLMSNETHKIVLKL